MNRTDLVADTICRTVELGVTITGAAIEGQFTLIECQPVDVDSACPSCGEPARLRDHVTRTLTDLPVAGYPTRLHVRLPRFTCDNSGCEQVVVRQRINEVAAPKASTTRRATRWIVQRLAIDKMSVAAIAKALGVGWDVINALALAATRSLVYDRPGHLDGVRVLGVDEHKWKHVRGQGAPNFVPVIVDLTPVVEGTGPARLLDMVPGRSAAALKGWLSARDQEFRERIQIVAMDEFTGYRTATTQELPQARAVMDPFHVVHLAAEKLTLCRQRIQQDLHGHRGRAGDPLYQIRRILLTRSDFLTGPRKDRLTAALACNDAHAAIEVTHWCYQDMIAAYANPHRRRGKLAMLELIMRLKSGLPAGLPELAQLGRTLRKRRTDILAYFDTGASNGPVEAINGRLEYLRGIALGFRNLEHYIVRSLLHSGGLQSRINAL